LVKLGMALNVVGLLMMAFGTSLAPLLAGRFVSGIGIGMAFPAIRRIIINGDPGNLGSNLGLLLAADVAGFATGPAISAVMVPTLGLPAPFITIAVVTVLCAPIVLRVEIHEQPITDAPHARLAFDLLRDRGIVAGLMMGSAVFLMIGTFDALWVLVLDDLEASDIIANLGITIFALPLIFLGSYGGRLAQRIGPFRLGPLGLLLGAFFIANYGWLPNEFLMLGFGAVHAVCDGLTVSSTAVGVGMVAPHERQASAQGLLGAAETLTAGITAFVAGVLYEAGGRGLAFGTAAAVMVALAVGSALVAGPERRQLRGVPLPSEPPIEIDPATAVTGHA
jgi:predicted MFS family arabinose efflux permease